MVSLELLNVTRAFLVEFEAAEPFISALSLISKVERDLDPHLAVIAAGGTALSGVAGNAHAHFAHARNVLPRISSRSFFRALDRLVGAIHAFASSNSYNQQIAGSLPEELEIFSRNFEAFLSDQSGVNAYPVLRGSTPLLFELEVLRRTLAGIAAQFEKHEGLEGDEEVFSILFPDEHDLDEIAGKLYALKAIFETVADLIDEPVSRTHRILRLEYGSLWIELAVAKKIINIARPWISALATYFYRTRTIEGSLYSTTLASKASIKQVLDVRQLLQKAGVPTAKMDLELEIAAAAMAKNVATLIGKQIRFKVDGQEFKAENVGLSLEQKIVDQLPPPQE